MTSGSLAWSFWANSFWKNNRPEMNMHLCLYLAGAQHLQRSKQVSANLWVRSMREASEEDGDESHLVASLI